MKRWQQCEAYVIVMTVVVYEDVLRLICGHAPQSGRNL